MQPLIFSPEQTEWCMVVRDGTTFAHQIHAIDIVTALGLIIILLIVLSYIKPEMTMHS